MSDKPQFPDDANGEVIRLLWENGDDLSTPREFDFGVVFEDEKAALDFAVALLRQEIKVSFSPAEEGEKLCEVCCHPIMIPDHTTISNFQSSLADIAEDYGGNLDGWECFVVKREES